MPADHISGFLPIVCVGFGLFLIGGANLLLLRRSFRIRLLATLAAAGLTVSAAAALNHSEVTVRTVELLAISLLPCLLLGSRWLAAKTSALVAALHRPAVRFGLLTTAGVGLSIGSVVVFERADEAAMDSNLVGLDVGHDRSPVSPTSRAKATTDKGTPVVLQEPTQPREYSEVVGAESNVLKSTQLDNLTIRYGPAGEESNCHGWVFTNNQFVVSGREVPLILAENGYVEVQEPEPGDLVVYRMEGQVVHSAIVRYVTEGYPVLVEGKWGAMGVFVHEPKDCPYGTDFTFYRSHRHGHLLAGLSEAAPSGGTTHAATAAATE